MKKITFCFLFFTVGFFLMADESYQIRIEQPTGGTHGNLPMPADEPDVYHNITAQEIIIDGPGAVSYYDVEIASATNWTVYISTQVSGSYGSIDISSLPQGEYVITIDSPLDNTYEGYFDTY